MKIYKEYYVSVKPSSSLAYVLPLTGSQNNIDKQKAKGKSWAKERIREEDGYWGYKEGESFTLKNEPTNGYEIIGFSDRYSTSNKHIYLKHPQGFHFEMAIETFIEMLKETTIQNGVIQEDLIIYTYKGKNALCVYGGDLYCTLEEDGVKYMKLSDIKEGDIISLKGISKINNKVTYIGKRKISADIELRYNSEQIKNICSNKPYDIWCRKEDTTNFVKLHTPETEVIIFLVEESGHKSLVGYTDDKKIKIISIVGNTPIDDSVIYEVIGDNVWRYSSITSTSYFRQQGEQVLKDNGYIDGSGYRAINNIETKLNKVYVEKV